MGGNGESRHNEKESFLDYVNASQLIKPGFYQCNQGSSIWN